MNRPAGSLAQCAGLPGEVRNSRLVAALARIVLFVAAGSGTVSAHEFSITPVTLVVAGDGQFQADVGLDADALAVGLPLEADSGEVAAAMGLLVGQAFDDAVKRARSTVLSDIRIVFDSAPAPFQVTFPHHGTAAASAADPPTVLGTVARIRGSVPAGAEGVVFRAPPRYKVVSLEVHMPSRAGPYRLVLDPGETSPALPLAGGPRAAVDQGVLLTYLKLGFTHIVPKGLDHILFVLGLFLLSVRWRSLLYQVTAFTVAHSVTLALSMQGVVSLPERVVETVIALSICWVAVENIATSALKPWRVTLVFTFGLLHGLGFAGVLSELGMPEGRFMAALLSFNLGVELGQGAVVLAAFAAAGRFRHLAGYRKYVVVPCSAAIALVGAWWAVTRAIG